LEDNDCVVDVAAAALLALFALVEAEDGGEGRADDDGVACAVAAMMDASAACVDATASDDSWSARGEVEACRVLWLLLLPVLAARLLLFEASKVSVS
jgi:hypothetical protein